MEESEWDTERGNSEQETDSNQPRKNKVLMRKRGATSAAWTWFGYEKSDRDNRLKHHQPLIPPTQDSFICRVYNSKGNNK